MNCEIVINPEFQGPTILEIESVLDNVQDPIEVSWANSSTELSILQKYRNRHFILVVPDLNTMERTACLTGNTFKLDASLIENTKTSLISKKGYNWRSTTEDLGMGVSRAIITKVSADSIRKGKRPIIASILSELFCDGVSSLDTDVLLRLKFMRTNV